jgi:hypothetical protein
MFEMATSSEDAVRKKAEFHSLDFVSRVRLSEVLAPSAWSVLMMAAAE